MSNVKRNLQIEAEAAKGLLANVRAVIGDDEEAIHDAVEGETSLIEVISDAVDRVAELEAHEKAIGDLMQKLADRKGRFGNQAEQIRTALCLAMGMAELKKLELPQATITLKMTPPKVVVTNEADIPSVFWKPSDPRLDKKALLDALKDKQTVPGAELSNGSETVSIRHG